MTPIIRPITAAETWPIRHQVMWPDQPFDYIKLPADAQGLHFGLWLDEQLVSVISLYIKKDVGQFRKFATLTNQQGKGYGRQLLAYLLTTATEKGVSKIWCNARVEKVQFYAKFGFITTNNRFNKKGIDYVVMERFY